MTRNAPVKDFLAAIPATIQAISQRIIHAILTLVSRTVIIAKRAVAAVAHFFARLARQTWHLYCRLELSIVEATVATMLIFWSLRLALLIIAPIAVLALFKYWAAAGIYVALLVVAVWRFYSVRPDDVERAAEEQAPLRALLTRLMQYVVRAALLLSTAAGVILMLSDLPLKGITNALNTDTKSGGSMPSWLSSRPESAGTPTTKEEARSICGSLVSIDKLAGCITCLEIDMDYSKSGGECVMRPSDPRFRLQRVR